MSAQGDLNVDDTRELSRFAAVTIVVVLFFAVSGLPIFLETGDVASAIGGLVLGGLALFLIYGRRQLLRGHVGRAAIIIVLGLLAGVLASAAIPPPVPALAAVPLLGVAFALAFLHGRQRTVTLVASWFVAVAAAIIVEVTPASPDLPPELAAVLRIGGMAAVVGLTGVVLYRHRGRLELAIDRARAAGEALRENEVRYRTVVEGVREVIFRIDAQGRWELLNRAWEELTHHTVAGSLGRPVLDFIHPDDRQHHADLVLPVPAGSVDEYRRELRLAGPDETPIWVEIHARPIHDELGSYAGMSGTLTDITERRVLQERLIVQAFHDELTGLANRALFKDRLEHALARRARRPGLVGLLFLDIDRFKTINDSLGHTAGDQLLTAVAHRLRAMLRPEDTIARLGGDEFAIVIEDVGSPEEALALAERIRGAFEVPFEHEDRPITITASIGVVVASGTDRSADDLLRDADVAMYRAKVGGRGSYALFERSMQAEVAARMELESDLRQAIEREQLSLVYQPIVSLANQQIMGVEALARWHHPVRGNIPPSIFIPSAEESGLIVALGRWVLRRACRDLAGLRALGGTAADLRLSVNVSPVQLREHDFVDDVLGALRDSGVPACALNLEVTESVVLDCGEEGIAYLRALRAAGCGVSLDDFGTGYSSLGNLRALPIDEIKIDVSFVSAVLDGGVDAAVVEAIVGLGAALGVAVIAEGIESAEVAGRLMALNCPFGQGYFYGRPEPAAALALRLSHPSLPAAA
jgi:diguanylate cyclase (GGDEF)-like protein/PAS domain S-box-containing protein